jgi:hypothetical protein
MTLYGKKAILEWIYETINLFESNLTEMDIG